MDSLEDCDDARKYASSTPMKLALSFQIILCIASISVTVLCLKGNKKSRHHPNYRFLLNLYLTTFIIHSIFLCSIQSIHLYSYVFMEPCDVPVTALTCFVFRQTTYSLVSVMSFTELFLTLERIIAFVCRPNYDKVGRASGICFTLLAVLLGYAYNIVLTSLSFPITGYYSYCSAMSIYRSSIFGDVHTFTLFSYSLIVIDSSSAIILYILSKVSRMKSKKENRTDYSLASRFEHQRNKDILAGLWPPMLLHSVFSIAFSVLQNASVNKLSTLDDQSTFMAIGVMSNMVPIYTTIAPLLMIYMQKKVQKNKAGVDDGHGDHYFKSYAKVW